MKKLILILAMLVLAGCASTGTTIPIEPTTVLHYKYIVTTVPAEMLIVPPPVPNIDLTTATDKDVAAWMLDGEQRTEGLEDRLKAVKTYLDNKIKTLNLPPDDVTTD